MLQLSANKVVEVICLSWNQITCLWIRVQNQTVLVDRLQSIFISTRSFSPLNRLCYMQICWVGECGDGIYFKARSINIFKPEVRPSY